MDPATLLSGAAHRWLPLLLEAALRGTVVLVLAALASRLLRGRGAAARHLAWELALVGLLVLPAALPLLPRWTLPVLPAAPAEAGVTAVAARAAPGVPAAAKSAASAAARAADEDGDIAITRRVAAVLTSPTALFLAWLVGFLVVLGRFGAARLRVTALALSARPPPDPRWRRLLDGLAVRSGVFRPVRLLLGPRTAPPMTWGVLRPTILLPEDAVAWSRERLRTVLLHELEHVRRADSPVQAVVRLVAAVYWFHPGVWLAAGRLRLERERACDDGVLRHGVQASEYGRQLVEFARRLRGLAAAASSALASGGRSDLSRRLEALLEAGRVRRPLTWWSAASGVCAGLTLLLVVGAVEPGRRATPPPPAVRARDAFLPAVAVPPPTGRPLAGPATARPSSAPATPDSGRVALRDPARSDSPARGRVADGPGESPPPRHVAARESPGVAGRSTGLRPPLPSPAPAGHAETPGAAPALAVETAAAPEAAAERLRALAPAAMRASLTDLVARGTTPALTEVMEMAYLAPQSDERVAAVRSLGRGGRRAGRFLLQIVRAHPEPAVRRAGLESLAGLESHRVVPWLVDVAYHDRDVSVQREAVRALAGVDGAGSDAGLLQLARSHPLTAVRLEAFFWLVRRGSGKALAAYVAAA